MSDTFSSSLRRSCKNKLDKLKLAVEENIDFVDDDASCLKSWINAAVKRKIQHLDVWCAMYEMMPLGLYNCETPVSLKLYGVTLDDVESFSLPCLKSMQLQFIWYSKEATFEKLVSSCPVLEKLKIADKCGFGNRKVFEVRSRSLKKLTILIGKEEDSSGTRFLIDAPRLCFLRVIDKLSESFIIKEMDFNAKVDISLPFGLDAFDEASISSRRSSISSFLRGISKVEDMTMCKETFKLIHEYSKIEPLPQFCYMSRLRVTFRVSDMKWLPTFLETCSNLKSLILVWNTNSKKISSLEMSQFNFSSVPECLLSSLEFVDIKTSISRHSPEMKLVRYFLENSTILKKLTLRLNHYCTNEKFIVKELLSMPRRSITCQVVIY